MAIERVQRVRSEKNSLPPNKPLGFREAGPVIFLLNNFMSKLGEAELDNSDVWAGQLV